MRARLLPRPIAMKGSRCRHEGGVARVIDSIFSVTCRGVSPKARANSEDTVTTMQMGHFLREAFLYHIDSLQMYFNL